MKSAIALTWAASLAAGVAAHGHHGHQHFHAKKNAVEKREPDVVTSWVVGPTETVYVLDDKVVDAKKAKQRIEDGQLVVIGESKPTFTPPPAPEPTTSSKPEMGAQFFESEASSKPETTKTPEPTTTTKEEPKPTKEAPKNGGSGGSLSGGNGLNREFPSGEVPCSEFPSAYGAIPLNWLNTGGWVGLQRTPKFSFAAKMIDEIHTGIAGETCAEGTFCSYACPPGYQKSQWPAAQGATGQSIGGLWCNSDGMLELTREGHKTLCEKGAGGIFIQNDLDQEVNSCRTDYPGLEVMAIPAQALPHQTVEVCNPEQDKYYQWQGKMTTAQIYINKAGYGLDDACVWNSPIDLKGAGDKSPAILGVGKAPDGNTYIGLFQNLPVSPDAKLNFDIEITGDLVGNAKCGYKNGQWVGGATGCTATVKPNGKAIIRYY